MSMNQKKNPCQGCGDFIGRRGAEACSRIAASLYHDMKETCPCATCLVKVQCDKREKIKCIHSRNFCQRSKLKLIERDIIENLAAIKALKKMKKLVLETIEEYDKKMENELMKTVYSPWSEEEVKNLNERQKIKTLHPYTCPNGHNLIARITGWYCDDCQYHQNWAHKDDVEGRTLTLALQNFLFNKQEEE